MSLHNLKKSLEGLKDYQVPVDPKWQASTRYLILEQARQDTPVLTWQQVLGSFLRRMANPASVSLAVFLSLTAGMVSTVQAAQKSLPGDNLYSVKRSWERVAYTLALQDDRRVQLEVRSAQRRVDELGLLVKNYNNNASGDTRREEKIGKAVNELHREISTVKYRLEKIRVEEPRKAAAIAKIIDSNTASYVKALKEVKKEIALVEDSRVKGEVGTKVNSALINIEDAGLQAALLMVKNPEDSIANIEEVRSSLEKKLETTVEIYLNYKEEVELLEKELNEVEKSDQDAKIAAVIGQAKELVAAAPVVLEDVQKFLDGGYLAQALEKLGEGQIIIQKMEQKIAKVAETKFANEIAAKAKEDQAKKEAEAKEAVAETQVNANDNGNSNINLNGNVNSNKSEPAAINSNENANTNSPKNIDPPLAN